MPLHLDSFNNNLPAGSNKDCHVAALEVFQRRLEKIFFSEVVVSNHSQNDSFASLVIEVECGLSLLEMLFHFNKGVWGNFQDARDNLENALCELQANNEPEVDIEEFSLFLKDTSIVVQKIYGQSIAQQLQNILVELGHHYVYFSKGLMEVPYEIFIPVFEELDRCENAIPIDGSPTQKNYFEYWGVYYESAEEACIYDLANLRLIDSDLYMLNRE